MTPAVATVPEASVTHVSFCRICAAHCGLRVEVADGRVARVSGDADNPLSAGFTCTKGRRLPDSINHPRRLLRTLKRNADGSVVQIATDDAIGEIAARVRDIIDQHGPRSVAMYSGNGVMAHSAGNYLGQRFLRAIGSPMWFSSGTIDQPGKEIAQSVHGRWGGGMGTVSNSDAWLFLGVNPVVSLWAGTGISNPIVTLRRARRDGLSLIVADPRRTETAAMADLYLPIKPGSDPILLAGMIRLIIAEDLVDHEFCDRNVEGIGALRAAVEPFSHDVVERRCGVAFADVERAARRLAAARRGGITAGTGPNMAGRGTLTEYLALSLMSIAGLWARAGDPVPNGAVLGPATRWVAQPVVKSHAWDWGEEIRSRHLPRTTMGMPTGAAADEILMDGPGRIRALFAIGGNPVMAWPDQLKTVEAMKHLDLLVCLDITETATSRFADYTLAGTHQLETPETTMLMELSGAGSPAGRHFGEEYGMYSPAIVDPPAGSDVIDETQFFFRLARTMGVQLKLRGDDIDMSTEPSVDEILELMTSGSRVPLATVKAHPHGYVDRGTAPEQIAAPAGDDGARLHVGHALMTDQLATLAADPVEDDRHPFRLISRRMVEVCNSMGQNLPALAEKRAYNPAYMHPDDLRELAIADGEVIEVSSARATVLAVVGADPTLRRGVVSCAHSWGDAPGFDRDPRAGGTNTNRLISNADVFDPWSGIPLMSDVPVSVHRHVAVRG